MLKFKNLLRKPPKGFNFADPDTGEHFNSHSWDILFAAVQRHREANSLPPISAEIIQDQNCRKLAPNAADEFCTSDAPVTTTDAVTLGWRDILNGTKVLGSFLLHGRPLVPKPEAERRAEICAKCEWNVTYRQPCGGDCDELLTLINVVVGNDATSHDSDLHACGICKCTNKANVWVPVEISRVGVSGDQLAMMPDACWKKQGILAL